jgi:NADH:ubiquinone oxidoreductase subunit 3 (subunit A)
VADYVPVLLFLLVAALVPVAILATAWVLRPSRSSAVKAEAYECGVPTSG